MIQAVLDKNNQAIAAGSVTVYNVDGNTGEYIGSTDEYLMVGVGIPASSYIDPPPTANAGYAVCRNVVSDAWEQIEDHRGAIVYDTTSQAYTTLYELGSLSTTQTLLSPATPYDTWNGTAWVTDAAKQKAAQIAAAVAEQTALLSAANIKTQLWQTQLLLGIITDADKETLTAWMKYSQAVQAIDISEAPNIIWPDVPTL